MIDSKRLEMRDLALDRLYRLKGMLGAVIFLMGGEEHSLDHRTRNSNLGSETSRTASAKPSTSSPPCP